MNNELLLEMEQQLSKLIYNDNKIKSNENKNPKNRREVRSFINLKKIYITSSGKSHKNGKQKQSNKRKSYI